MSATTDPERSFTRFYEATYLDVLAFVQRRAPNIAEDVVAETMMTVWRRINDLPADPDSARAWAFGIARHCLSNSRRSNRRHDALTIRLAEHPSTTTTADASDEAVRRLDVARAFERLTPEHQEALALTVLDGLTSEQAGIVLGIAPAAYRHRLARARQRLRDHLEDRDTEVPDPTRPLPAHMPC